MKEVTIDIVSAGTEALREECVRVGLDVPEDAQATAMRQALRNYVSTTYKTYLEWVEWNRHLAIPDLTVTDDTTLPQIIKAVCDYLYNRLAAEGLIDIAMMHPVAHLIDSKLFYVTGRPSVEWVSTFSTGQASESRCHVAFAAACVFPDVELAWWNMEEWRQRDNH